jgi:4-diphosphocytidyl-2-C-methyl-D-erythritol kinase
MEKLTLPSYAKINLGLSIQRKRDDGYHDIETILHQVDLKDEIELQRFDSAQIRMSCDDPELPTDETNLCIRAAQLLKNTYQVKDGVFIKLSKNIPIGAGLGGGSSNAAVVLMGLNKLWNLGLGPEQLSAQAAQLGSDVPFFIYGGSAIARGRGEQLTPLDINHNMPILLIFPPFSISTRWAYGLTNLILTNTKKYVTLPHFRPSTVTIDFIRSLKNDFEDIVFPEYPVLDELKRQVSEHNAFYVSMSGTGSTLFGLFRRKSESVAMQKALQQGYGSYSAYHINWGYKQVL